MWGLLDGEQGRGSQATIAADKVPEMVGPAEGPWQRAGVLCALAEGHASPPHPVPLP